MGGIQTNNDLIRGALKGAFKGTQVVLSESFYKGFEKYLVNVLVFIQETNKQHQENILSCNLSFVFACASVTWTNL